MKRFVTSQESCKGGAVTSIVFMQVAKSVSAAFVEIIVMTDGSFLDCRSPKCDVIGQNLVLPKLAMRE